MDRTYNQATMIPKGSQNNGSFFTLPLDVSYHVVDFLEVKDIPCLLAANRSFRQLFDQEEVFEQFARRKFPAETLRASSYEGSWKQLLRDDNSKNGLYLRRMFVLSEWRDNRKCDDLHYMNAIRCMIWDKRNRRVHIGIEAFGSRDLRNAASTSIFQIQGEGFHPRHLGQQTSGRRSLPLPELERRLEVEGVIQLSPSTRSQSHDLCLLTLEDRWFNESGCSYMFTYNGSLNSLGSDYECKFFLRDCSSLRECFQLGYSKKIVGLNDCEFVSNDTLLLGPSNVLDWPDIAIALEFDHENHEERQKIKDYLLPPYIRQLHLRGQWGAVYSM